MRAGGIANVFVRPPLLGGTAWEGEGSAAHPAGEPLAHMALLVLALARVEGVLSQRPSRGDDTAVCLIAHVTKGGSPATAVENSLELGSRSTVPFAISSFSRASRGSD